MKRSTGGRGSARAAKPKRAAERPAAATPKRASERPVAAKPRRAPDRPAAAKPARAPDRPAAKRPDLRRSAQERPTPDGKAARAYEELERALGEALEQQRATSEVLKVISSAFELRPVLDAILEKAVELTGADAGNMYVAGELDPAGEGAGGLPVLAQIRTGVLSPSDVVYLVASRGVPEEVLARMPRAYPLVEADRSLPGWRTYFERRAVHVPDTLKDPDHRRNPQYRDGSVRSVLAVPLLRDDLYVGSMTLWRKDPSAFTPRQIALVETFATQAVIAIENVRLFKETKEGLQRQTAIGEILSVISTSPADIQPVLDTIAESATRFCGAEDASVLLLSDGALVPTAHHGPIEMQMGERIAIDRTTVSGRALLEQRTVHVEDVTADDEFPGSRRFAELDGQRTVLASPLVREGKAIGVIALRRSEPRAFSEQQVKLVDTFADQAVIAIENVRLFNETTEALDQQTATAEVLDVISRSTTDLAPVFQTIAEKALRLCEGDNASILHREGEVYRWVANAGFSPDESAAVERAGPLPIRPGRGSLTGRVLLQRRPVQIVDSAADPEYDLALQYATPEALEDDVPSSQSLLGVPMIRADDLIGVIIVRRQRVGPYSDRQIALLEVFAAQAVIAIENVRLFNETKESLEQQTATAQVLKTISRSAFDLQAVLSALVENAARLSRADVAWMTSRLPDRQQLRAEFGLTPEEHDEVGRLDRLALTGRLREISPAPRLGVMNRIYSEGKTIQIADITAEPDTNAASPIVRALRGRTVLAVPVRREDAVIAGFVLLRRDARVFTEREVELVETFADQAAIAIENVRLFNETKEALEQQTATAEILEVISRATEDLQPVFEAIAQKAVVLCDATNASVIRREGDYFRHAANAGQFPDEEAFLRVWSRRQFRPGRETLTGRVLLERRSVQIEDVEADPEYDHEARAAIPGRMRTILGVPMLKEGGLIGVLIARRAEVRPFADRQIRLLETFAAQSVIAIENVRLFNETKEALERQTATGEILRAIAGSPTSEQPVLDAIARSAVRFCGAEDAAVLLAEGHVFRAAAHEGPLLTEYENTWPLDRSSVSGRAMMDKQLIHVPDIQDVADEFTTSFGFAQLSGQRAMAAAPLLREGRAIGAILLRRSAPGPFAERQLELLNTFADQAVIAIENVRLFNETKEALEQQTATADLLKVISTSNFELGPVFDAVAQNAVELCGADNASIIYWRDEGAYRYIANAGTFPDQEEFTAQWEGFKVQPGRGTLTGRVLLERGPVQIEDIDTDPEYEHAGQKASGTKTHLAVPLLKDGEPIGAIIARRFTARLFTEQQVRLLETFAAQAVIAIENTRLFNETKDSLERQTAIARILEVISSSMTASQPVLDTIAESTVRFCGGEDSLIALVEGKDTWRSVAHFGEIGGTTQVGRVARPIDRGSLTGRTILERRTIHVPDVLAEAGEFPLAAELARQQGFRSALATPLLRGDQAIGGIGLRKREAGPFTDRQIELLETFARQAVIALENVRLFNETKEALEQQTATSEVLNVISRSANDVTPVLDAIVETAVRLCDADSAVAWRRVQDHLILTAYRGLQEEAQRIGGHTRPLDDMRNRTGPEADPLSRMVRAGSAVHIPDLAAEPEVELPPTARDASGEYRYRTVLVVPILREGELVGAISLRRTDVRPFSERQIELVTSFADQAAIAIENVRLFNETKEALDRQSAVAEVLATIGRSAFDLQAVLDAVIERATKLCDADQGFIYRRDGETFRLAADHGISAEFRAFTEAHPIPAAPDRGTLTGRVMEERRAVMIADVLNDPEYTYWEAQRLANFRSLLNVPLLREGEVIGVMGLWRTEPRAFTEQQAQLVSTFADQAVIAIESARSFAETRSALDRQTAVADVLATISRSVFDLEAILETVIQNAVRLCRAKGGLIFRREGEIYRLAAMHGGSEAFFKEAKERSLVVGPGRGAVTMRAVAAGAPVQIEDVTVDPEYASQDLQRIEGFRTVLGVPLFHKGEATGAMSLWRNEVRAFSPEEIELVRTFADQAAIAIENVRLFNETKEALEQQTATAEVLNVISQSTFDVQPVLDAVVQTAGRLARADAAWLLRLEGGQFVGARKSGYAAEWGATPELARRLAISHGGLLRAWNEPAGVVMPELAGDPDRIRILAEINAAGADPKSGSIMGWVSKERRTIHLADVTAEPGLRGSGIAYAVGARTVLAVPLLRQDEAIGYMVIARTRVEPFTEREVALVETFAGQAAIAIENVRLFNEIQDKSRQLEVASRHKSEFLANMSHELRTPLNAIIGFTDVMLQEMFGPLNEKQKEYLDDVRGSGAHLLTLINDILDLSKIEAGRVELDLTEFSFLDALENALTLVRERAARHGITIAPEVAADVATITADERKLKQILVNLLSNAVKFTPDGGWVGISVSRADGEVVVAVRDTGIGIAPEDHERVFEEFQQVGRGPERAREGTGLGLTLSKRFVELHGGRIWVESELGKGSTFTFAVPVRQTALAKDAHAKAPS